MESRVLGAQEKVQPRKTIAFDSDEFLKLAERLAGEGRAGCISLSGEVLLQVDGETVLVK